MDPIMIVPAILGGLVALWVIFKVYVFLKSVLLVILTGLTLIFRPILGLLGLLEKGTIHLNKASAELNEASKIWAEEVRQKAREEARIRSEQLSIPQVNESIVSAAIAQQLTRSADRPHSDLPKVVARDTRVLPVLDTIKKVPASNEKLTVNKAQRTDNDQPKRVVSRPPGADLKNKATDAEKTAALDACRVRHLYHITHIDNLPGIVKNGLFSHNTAHRKLSPVDVSMQDVNERRAKLEPVFRKSLHDYVPLYFNPRNPMLFKLDDISSELAIISLNRDLILRKGSVFSEGNAAAKNTRFYSNIEFLRKIDWEFMWAEYWNDYADGKRKKCAEVLVPEEVKTQYIERIIVKSESTLQRVDKAVKSEVRCVVDTGIFSWRSR